MNSRIKWWFAFPAYILDLIFIGFMGTRLSEIFATYYEKSDELVGFGEITFAHVLGYAMAVALFWLLLQGCFELTRKDKIIPFVAWLSTLGARQIVVVLLIPLILLVEIGITAALFAAPTLERLPVSARSNPRL